MMLLPWQNLRVKGGAEWEVKKILDKRRDEDTGDMEYHVEWTGAHWPDTWEPECHIVGHADDALAAYVARTSGAATKKGSKKKKKK
jgi:hypothetical protein